MAKKYPKGFEWLKRVDPDKRAAHLLRFEIVQELLDHHEKLINSRGPGKKPPSQARKVRRVISSLNNTDPNWPVYLKKLKEIENLPAREKFNALRNLNEQILDSARFAPFDVPHHPDPVRFLEGILRSQAPEVADRAKNIIQIVDPSKLKGEEGIYKYKAGSMHPFAHTGNLGKSSGLKIGLGSQYGRFSGKWDPGISAHYLGTSMGEGALPNVNWSTTRDPILLAAQIDTINTNLDQADRIGKELNRQRWTDPILDTLAPDNVTLQRAIKYPELAKPGDLDLATEVLNKPGNWSIIKKGLLESEGVSSPTIQQMAQGLKSRFEIGESVNRVEDWYKATDVKTFLQDYKWKGGTLSLDEAQIQQMLNLNDVIKEGTGYNMTLIPGMNEANFKMAARFIRNNWKGEALGIISDERVLEQVLKGNYKKAAEHGVTGAAVGGAIQAGLRHSPKVLTRLGVPVARAGMLQSAAKAVVPGLLPLQARELANVASKHYTGKDLEQHVIDTDKELVKSGITQKPGAMYAGYMSSAFGGPGADTFIAAQAFEKWLKDLDIFGRASRAWNNR